MSARYVSASLVRTSSLLGDRVAVADRWPARLRGLLGRRNLHQGEGLLLRPCNGVHTMFMRFAIDVAFLDRVGRLVRTCHSVAPFRVVPWVRGATQALELPAGTLRRVEAFPGDLVIVCDLPES